METLGRTTRYILAIVAGLSFFFFLAEVGSSREQVQRDAGQNLGRALICGAIASWWFYSARKKKQINTAPSTPPSRVQAANAVATDLSQNATQACTANSAKELVASP